MCICQCGNHIIFWTDIYYAKHRNTDNETVRFRNVRKKETVHSDQIQRMKLSLSAVCAD
jgi:ribosomal protein L35